MDIKVLNTNLRFVLIFNRINMNNIMIKSSLKFHKFTYLFSTLFTPEIQMKVYFCVLGNLRQAFPYKTIF